MLSVSGSPRGERSPAARARTSNGSASSYGSSHLDAGTSVRRTADGVEILTEDGTTHRYDAVVMATHPDQALRLLTDPTDAERQVLGAFRYSRNPRLLHTDSSVLPRGAGGPGVAGTT